MEYLIEFAVIATPGQPEDIPADILESQGLERNPEVFDQLEQGNQWGLTDIYVHCNLVYQNGARFSGTATVRKSYTSKEDIHLRLGELQSSMEQAWFKMKVDLRRQCEALNCSVPGIKIPDAAAMQSMTTVQCIED